MTEIFLSPGAIKTCLGVSLQQYATIDRPLLSMEVLSNLESDTWVGSSFFVSARWCLFLFVLDCPSMNKEKGGTVNISDAFESYGTSLRI